MPPDVPVWASVEVPWGRNVTEANQVSHIHSDSDTPEKYRDAVPIRISIFSRVRKLNQPTRTDFQIATL